MLEISMRAIARTPVSVRADAYATELAIELLVASGHDPEGLDTTGQPIGDEVQTLLTEVFLRLPALRDLLAAQDLLTR